MFFCLKLQNLLTMLIEDLLYFPMHCKESLWNYISLFPSLYMSGSWGGWERLRSQKGTIKDFCSGQDTVIRQAESEQTAPPRERGEGLLRVCSRRPPERMGHPLTCPRCRGYRCLQDSALWSGMTDSAAESLEDLWALPLGKARGRGKEEWGFNLFPTGCLQVCLSRTW